MASESEPPEADPPAEFDEFTIVLLFEPPNPPRLDEAEEHKIQRQHLGHFAAMRRRGALVFSGPFRDQPDRSWRGMCIYRTGLEETRALAQSDPAVKRGVLSILALRWVTQKGSVSVRD